MDHRCCLSTTILFPLPDKKRHQEQNGPITRKKKGNRKEKVTEQGGKAVRSFPRQPAHAGDLPTPGAPGAALPSALTSGDNFNT